MHTAPSPVRFAITVGGAGAEQRIDGTASLPTGVWKHVAVTLSGSVGVLYLAVRRSFGRSAAILAASASSFTSFVGSVLNP